MSSKNEPSLVANDMVVSMSYSLSSEGELIDQTEEGETLDFIQGFGSIISGLEQRLFGLAEGEKVNIKVPANDAYGDYDMEQIVPIPLSEFPDDFDLEPGLELEMKDNEGDKVYARIVSVGKTRVKMDFNHPLAGKDLDFDVTILAVRPATPHELEQGFVE